MTAKKMQPNFVDKRKSERQDLQLLISYYNNNQTFSKFSYNLSSGGMFIESITPPSVGSSITINFELPHNKISFDIKGEVTWINTSDGPELTYPAGFGVKFFINDIEIKRNLELALQFFKKYSMSLG